MKQIGAFKHKSEILLHIFDCDGFFLCEAEPSVDWEQFTDIQREAIHTVPLIVKPFKTLSDLKRTARYWTGDFHFEWEV